jgi:APA family basic amino acid/polyamine antiporter
MYVDGHTNYSLIASAAGVTLWSFIGMEAATIPYDHVKNPTRNIPLATIVGIIFASLIYIVSSILIMGLMPANILLNSTMSPFVIVAQMLLGSAGKWIFICGAIISCLGCMNGLIFLQSQIVNAAAEDGLFPKVFAMKNRFGVPAAGLVLTALLQTILILMTIHKDSTEKFQLIVIIASLASLIPYLYAAAASLIIFKQLGREKYAIKNSVYVAIAFLTAIYSFWVIMISGSQIILHGSFLIFIGVILYALICEK